MLEAQGGSPPPLSPPVPMYVDPKACLDLALITAQTTLPDKREKWSTNWESNRREKESESAQISNELWPESIPAFKMEKLPY